MTKNKEPIILSMSKCQCGDKVCNSYRLDQASSGGMFEKTTAAFIVKAANSHIELIEALQGAYIELERAMKYGSPYAKDANPRMRAIKSVLSKVVAK